MAANSYRDLEVWQKSMDLVEAVYRLTAGFPKEERYGLASQMQRAAVSGPANIAEGYGRTHRGDYTHHLSIGRGSLAELETLVTISVRVKYVSRDEAVEMWNLIQQVGKMLRRLHETLAKKSSTTKTKP